MENLGPNNESRIIFNYLRVKEDLPSSYIELSSKVYNNLSNPKYKCLFTVDLKYIYLIIPLYLEDRYFFAFIISGIG